MSIRSFLVGGAALALVAACSIAAPASPDSANGNATASPQPPATTDATGPTFASDIEAIVQDKCQSCHREGGVAPFSLMTYEEVTARANIAKLKIESREMPPWGAFDDESCKVEHKLKDNLSLSPQQIETFGKWVANGMPLGDPAKRPPAKSGFAASTLVDKTDTFPMAAPHKVSPGKDDIRCFPIDPNFTEDAWIGATNVIAGDPRVVHHVIVFQDLNHKAKEKAGADGSYECFGGPDVGGIPSILVAWAPGVPPTNFGEEAGLKVPKGSGLVMQVHYHPTNVPVEDRSQFELKRLVARPKNVAQVILAGNAENAEGSNTRGLVKLLPGADDPAGGPAFAIPANAPAHKESMILTMPMTTTVGGASFPIPQLRIAAAGAHMHWAGVDMKIDIERKDASTGPAKECLLGTPKYDFNWQRGYAYDEPYDSLPTLNAGDKVRFTCTFNNTMQNRHVAKAMSEMEPPQSTPLPILLGETTGEEMCLGVMVVLRPYVSFVDK